MGNWHAKQKGNFKLKYSWIAKRNSDGTSFFLISCPEAECGFDQQALIWPMRFGV